MMCEIVNKVIVEEEIVDCPICMDQIEGEKNKVITECGHCFHTSCLMKNVAHNGFGCPYCRDTMAEEPDDNNSDEEYDEFSIDEEEENDYSDNVLRGSRWLFQRAEGEELDDEEDTVLDEEEPQRVEVEPRAPVEYIVEKLLQRGVSMADLVKSILIRDHEEYQFHDEFDRADDELFGKFRIIISNYQPPAPEPVSLVEDQAPVLENNNADETVLTVMEAMNLIHRGPIPRGLVVNSNDPDYRKFKSRCDMFFTVRAL
jgi:hypothetical protein